MARATLDLELDEFEALVAQIDQRWARDAIQSAVRKGLSRIATKSQRPFRTSIRAEAGRDITRKAKVRLLKKNRKFLFPGFFFGVERRDPLSRRAGILEVGTKDINPGSFYPAVTPKRAGQSAMTVPQDATAKAAGSPSKDSRELIYIPFRRPRMTRFGHLVGGFYEVSALKRVRRSGDLSSIRAAYLAFKRVSHKPKFFLRDAVASLTPQLSREITAWVASYLGLNIPAETGGAEA